MAELISELRLWHLLETDPDAGVHGAVEWLLRKWGLGKEVDEWVEQMAPQPGGASPRTPIGAWYLTSQKQTFTIVESGDFRMGSPESEADRFDDERLHQRRVGRRFAIMTTEVTHEQWERFRNEIKDIPRFVEEVRLVKTEDSPVIWVDWFEAARYCNWLSEQEGIPKEQWCYEERNGEVQPKPKILELEGYRLPTEAEWEMSCRAGSWTARPFGETERWLGEYAWSLKNSDEQTHPVRSLKPNELGLFGTIGNVWEWCQDSFSDYPESGQDGFVLDVSETGFDKTKSRLLRGGAFALTPTNARAACRDRYAPGVITASVGFRPARTYP